MSDSPSISVVVPFFNSERYIGACIDSLVHQEGVDGTYELIFVNNRSADASASIVEHATEIVSLSEDTIGAYAARNTGIRYATAPLIAFTDADCVADSNWLRSIQDAMRQPDVAILVGHLRYSQRASLALRALGAYENARTEHALANCTPVHHLAYANNMAVRATLFEELGPFQEWKRAADTELVHRMAFRRPELRISYSPSMRITHLEFSSARDRARRLSLYTRTNSRVGTFRELGLGKRIATLKLLLRRNFMN